jgi:hypothetical protein
MLFFMRAQNSYLPAKSQAIMIIIIKTGIYTGMAYEMLLFIALAVSVFTVVRKQRAAEGLTPVV